MSGTLINKDIEPYRQVTSLTDRTSCFVEKKPSDIQSLMFWFDNCDNVIPSTFEIFNGTFFTTYDGIKIVKITDKETEHNTLDEYGCYRMFYDSEYVHNNYGYALNETRLNFEDLVGYYFVDWTENESVILHIRERNSEYIELNYYIEKVP